MICEIQFDNAPSFTTTGDTKQVGEVVGYVSDSKKWVFHFGNEYIDVSDAPETSPNKHYIYDARGNLTVSRTLNKNIMASNIPITNYFEGNIGVDIGFTDDSFSIQFETYSFDEYRYLMALVKSNNGMRTGLFRFGPSSSWYDQFIVTIRNLNVSFEPGKGFYSKISMTLMIISPEVK